MRQNTVGLLKERPIRIRLQKKKKTFTLLETIKKALSMKPEGFH